MYKIGIVGAKNSGKTTLIEKVINELSKRSINVMSIKHTAHQHNFDTEGKDSYRHRNAGASLTLAINPSEFALFSQCDDMLLSKIENLIAESFDICLVEGDKFSDIPKILLTRNIPKIDKNNIENILVTYGDDNNSCETHFFTEEINQLCDFIIEQAEKETLIERTP
jgi:molybdopterin-guanine dinucleotide biosynthesis protein B